jgi:hypothetical protein
VKAPPSHLGPQLGEMDIAATATVQVTSEDAAHPIEHVFDHRRGPGGSRWIAAEPGEQTLILAFDTPQTLHQTIVEVEEREVSRTQELLSLSRLNHRLPWCQAYPEVVQGTAEFHHQITDTLLPQTAPVFHDATTLDTAVDMLDPEPTLVEPLVGPFLLPCQLLATGFLGRHENCHFRKREGQEAQIL